MEIVLQLVLSDKIGEIREFAREVNVSVEELRSRYSKSDFDSIENEIRVIEDRYSRVKSMLDEISSYAEELAGFRAAVQNLIYVVEDGISTNEGLLPTLMSQLDKYSQEIIYQFSESRLNVVIEENRDEIEGLMIKRLFG